MAASRITVRRRRSRSVRVSGSLALLAIGVVCVLVSLPTQSPRWHSVWALATLAFFGGALQCMWSEVLHSRRANAADRVAAAAAYRSLSTASTAEQTEFTIAMTERLAEAHLAQRELEGLVTQLESRSQGMRQRLTEAQAQVRHLEAMLVLRAGQADGVTDLVTWEEQTVQKSTQLRSALKPA